MFEYNFQGNIQKLFAVSAVPLLVVAMIPLMQIPSCLVAFVFVMIATSKPVLTTYHMKIFLNNRNSLMNLNKIDESPNSISTWDKFQSTTITPSDIESKFPVSIYNFSSILAFDSYDQYVGTVFALFLLGGISVAIFSPEENQLIYFFISTGITLSYYLFGINSKYIAQVDHVGLISYNEFNKYIDFLSLEIVDTKAMNWISILRQNSANNRKYLPVILKRFEIKPTQVVVQNNIKSENECNLSKLIRDNNFHLYGKSQRAVIAIVIDDEILTANGYVEIPESRIQLDVLGDDFKGKTLKTYVRILSAVHEDQGRKYSQYEPDGLKFQSEIEAAIQEL